MRPSLLLKISAVLWVVWGLVHSFAGIIVISGDTTSAIQAIADGVNPETLEANYPDALDCIFFGNNH